MSTSLLALFVSKNVIFFFYNVLVPFLTMI